MHLASFVLKEGDILFLVCAGGGRKRLPKFKFSAKFPIGFTRDFTNTDKKIRK